MFIFWQREDFTFLLFYLLLDPDFKKSYGVMIVNF